MGRTTLAITLIVAGLALGMIAPAVAQQQNQTPGTQDMNQFQLTASCTLVPTQSQQEMPPFMQQQQQDQRPVMVCQYYADGEQDQGVIEGLRDWFSGLGGDNQTRQNQTVQPGQMQ